MENSAKILLLGKTGAGKSSFINYFLGKNVAKAGAGKPVTQDYFIPYEIEGGHYPINIFDTKGLEALGANEQLEEIINGIKERNNGDDVFNWFHTIFYCLSMSTRFEDFEAKFIRRLQEELSQHVHIILTHCDACKPESVAHMRERIKNQLGDLSNIEIFEVVCVSKKKRNGQVVEPYGKEKISECVFDFLLKDIAWKLSCDYADTLWWAWHHMVNDIFSELNDFINETFKIHTLFDFVRDSNQIEESLEYRMDEVFLQIDDNIELIQKQTDEQFKKLLCPAAQLYASYRGIVTDSYVKDAALAFSNMFEWMDTDWVDTNEMLTKIMPRMSKYMNENGEFSDDSNNSVSEIFSMIGAGIGDLLSLKKNIKESFEELRLNIIYQMLPSRDKIQDEVNKRIIQYIKPDTLFEDGEPQTVSGAMKNLRNAIGELKENTDELTDTMTELHQSAEVGDEKVADINEIMRQILEEGQNG